MTLYLPKKQTCAVCGHSEERNSLMSSHQIGSPDLDFRPAPDYRNTMCLWIQDCPRCGYVAPNISRLDPRLKKQVIRIILRSPEYKSCMEIPFRSETAKDYFKDYMLEMFLHETEEAFISMLRAAWACDDRKDISGAKYCRKECVRLIDLLIAEGYQQKSMLSIVRLDLLRRMGCFDQVIQEYSRKFYFRSVYRKMCKAGVKLALQKDASCHTIEDAFELVSRSGKKRKKTDSDDVEQDVSDMELLNDIYDETYNGLWGEEPKCEEWDVDAVGAPDFSKIFAEAKAEAENSAFDEENWDEEAWQRCLDEDFGPDYGEPDYFEEDEFL